jgi:hypothetical protein
LHAYFEILHGQKYIKYYCYLFEGKVTFMLDLEDQGVDSRIILRWIFRKWMKGGRHELD